MIWVDYCIVALLLVSTVVGVLRGFARETFGLITWVLAVWASFSFGRQFGHYLEPYIEIPSVRIAAGYAALFLLALLAGSIITALIVRTLRSSATLSSTDRTLGGGFGLLRGALLIAAFIVVAGMTPARQDPWWQQSMMLKQFDGLANGLRSVLPQSWLEQLKPIAEDPASVVTEKLPSSF